MPDDTPEANGSGSSSGEGTEPTDRRSRGPDAADELDLVFDLLQAERRRYLLYYLFEMEDDGTTYDAAAAAVAEYEAITDAAPSLEAVRRDLYHVQLPRLDAAGVVECDDRQQYVRFCGHDALEQWVEAARQAELD